MSIILVIQVMWPLVVCERSYTTLPWVEVVFQGPVATKWKYWQLNWTTTVLDLSTVAGPRGSVIASVVVVSTWAKVKDWSHLGLVAHSLK